MTSCSMAACSIGVRIASACRPSRRSSSRKPNTRPRAETTRSLALLNCEAPQRHRRSSEAVRERKQEPRDAPSAAKCPPECQLTSGGAARTPNQRPSCCCSRLSEAPPACPRPSARRTRPPAPDSAPKRPS
eukprot:scaffold396_cov252-Pinguiococcus_pyrenoidosus.AAC.9